MHPGTISNTVPGGLAPTLGETVLGESPERETFTEREHERNISEKKQRNKSSLE